MKFELTSDFLRNLTPGSLLTLTECEQITGVRRAENPMDYALAAMVLSKQIEKYLHQHKKNWTVRVLQCEVHILSHRLAALYNERAFRNGRRKLHRANKRLRGVNAAELTNEERNQLDRSLVRQANILGAIRSQEHVPLMPTVRTVPSMRPAK